MTLSKTEKLLKEYGYIIYCKALRDYNFNQDEAQDIFTDVSIRLVNKLKKDPDAKITKGWFRVASDCACKDMYRKQRHKKPEISFDSIPVINKKYLGSLVLPIKTPSMQDTEVRAIDENVKYCIIKAFNKLRPKTRDIMMYRFIEGLEYREIAKKIGCPIDTIKTAIHRARIQLLKNQELKNLIPEF